MNYEKLQNILNLNRNKRKQNNKKMLEILQQTETDNKKEYEKLKKQNEKLLKQNQYIIKQIQEQTNKNRTEKLFQNDLILFSKS